MGNSEDKQKEAQFSTETPQAESETEKRQPEHGTGFKHRDLLLSKKRPRDRNLEIREKPGRASWT